VAILCQRVVMDDIFYYIVFFIFVLPVVGLVWLQGIGGQADISAAQKAFRNNYLLVYSLQMRKHLLFKEYYCFTSWLWTQLGSEEAGTQQQGLTSGVSACSWGLAPRAICVRSISDLWILQEGDWTAIYRWVRVISAIWYLHWISCR
jgi:hypothetical protein